MPTKNFSLGVDFLSMGGKRYNAPLMVEDGDCTTPPHLQELGPPYNFQTAGYGFFSHILYVCCTRKSSICPQTRF
jgi:hypothetical protein